MFLIISQKNLYNFHINFKGKKMQENNSNVVVYNDGELELNVSVE
jgi:hypothetical protein